MATKMMMAGERPLLWDRYGSRGAATIVPGRRDAPRGLGGPSTIQAKPPTRLPKSIREQAQPDGRAFSLAISPDGKTLAAGCTDGSVRLLDARTGERRLCPDRRHREDTFGGWHSPRTARPSRACAMIIGCGSGTRTSGKLLKALPALSDMQQCRLTAAICPIHWRSHRTEV